MKLRSIEILEKDSNKKGDLFGRLMADLFHTLGYDEPRLNIHKSGREIDLTSDHRTESKIAIAECKAHSEPIGGADINKFIGIIDAEKRKIRRGKMRKYHSLVGYFISLSGFKETAIEQEKDFDNERVILIKPDKIVSELIKGRILVSTEKAVSSLLQNSINLDLVNHADLLAYDRGWVWALYFSNSQGQNASHVALIHAEGKPLLKELAQEIILLDTSINNIFKGLELINIEIPDLTISESLIKAETKYFNYLKNELGEIQFEGLPTDKEAGSVKVQLENIFIPLHLTKIQSIKKENPPPNDLKREGIGDILSKKTRLAILAKPGGGKSTLIKRIAIAYAFPERRNKIADNLPDRNWFPVFLRCRELGDKVVLSITDIIKGIPTRAELHSYSDQFSILVSRTLQNGNALLLIDGLDEIAEDKNRIAFVNQLRTFIATYPTINIIVTSREAGFRTVAGSLATYCENYSVSNLIYPEIKELCSKWHKAIIDDSENTVKEADKLSELILKDSRISALAENPLLLTTLLFVKRWAGYLPTKRSVLYQEMIKLLLVTWNVEGHEILEIEEAEPQLAFVAYWMTKNRKQTISADELNNCLIDARKQMPEILGYTTVSPPDFIRRVESRSSLLILSGHKRQGTGNITAMYEFLHLSFQEYLTAKAIVKRYIPLSDSRNEIVDIIKPNINNENWKEVIPLAAVLLERECKSLIEYLIAEAKTLASRDEKRRAPEENLAPFLLGSCLANEIQIGPELLGIGIEWYAKNIYTIRNSVNTEIILKNKFGSAFRKRVIEKFFEIYDDKHASSLGGTLGEVFLIDAGNSDDSISVADKILIGLNKNTKEEKCVAILGMMNFVYEARELTSNTKEIFEKMFELLKTKDLHYHFSISWCVAWSGESNIFPEIQRLPYILLLAKSWIKSGEFNFQRTTAWALSKIIIPSLPEKEISRIPKIRAAITENYNRPNNEYDKIVAIYLGIIVGLDFNISEITKAFKMELETRPDMSYSLSLFASKLNIALSKPDQNPEMDFM